MLRIYILLVVMLLTSAALAGEPRITETENGIVVEYTGEPAQKKNEIESLDESLVNKQHEAISKQINDNIAETKKRLSEEALKAKKRSKADLKKDRQNVATSYEYRLLNIGLNAQVFLSKTDSTVLYIHDRLMNRPLAYKLFADFIDAYVDMDSLVKIGFKKVIMTNGVDFAQPYQITK